MGDMIDLRRRMIASQPHVLSASGGLVQFTTDLSAPLIVTGSGNITRCGKNLFDKASVTVGANIGTDGSVGYSGNSRLTDYIPVNGHAVFWAKTLAGGSALRLGLYDANKAWISRQVSSAKVGSYTRLILNNDNVRFVRADIFVNSEDINTAMFEIGSSMTTFEEYTGTTVASGTQIDSLVGLNSLWSDSGEIAVRYWTH